MHRLILEYLVKLNNPLMGTEITGFEPVVVNKRLLVKLNNPLMGTEIFFMAKRCTKYRSTELN